MVPIRSLRKSTRILFPAMLMLAASVVAQDRFAGTALVRTSDAEYKIPIECNDAAKPELGFSTEPARVTREATGRTSGVRLTARPWQDTEYLVVTLDRYVAWVPTQSAHGGVLSMTLDMSPASTVIDGIPQTLTFDEWMAGNRPAGLSDVMFEADCSQRDPEAPAYRKLQ